MPKVVTFQEQLEHVDWVDVDEVEVIASGFRARLHSS